MASSTVRATAAGSSANPPSRSADTGSSVAETMTRACSSASSLVTAPSGRPSVRAKPLLVVARARKPSEASSLAEPASQGLGSSSGSPAWCSERNWSALPVCMVTPIP